MRSAFYMHCLKAECCRACCCNSLQLSLSGSRRYRPDGTEVLAVDAYAGGSSAGSTVRDANTHVHRSDVCQRRESGACHLLPLTLLLSCTSMHRHGPAQRRAATRAAGAEHCTSSSALGQQQGLQQEQGLQHSGGSRRRRGPEALHALSVAQPEREASSAGAGREEADSAAAQQERVGVLLLNLGGPETLEDVQPFLYNLFADDSIIRLPPYGVAGSLRCCCCPQMEVCWLSACTACTCWHDVLVPK